MTTRASRNGLHVPASRVGRVLPKQMVVEPATLDIGGPIKERLAPDNTLRYAAEWSQGRARGQARIEIRPTSKVSTDIVVELSHASGAWAFFWGRPRRHRLAALFANALAYHVETRDGEKAHAFDVRRTTPELVRARSA